MKRRIISIVLVMVFMFSMGVSAFAAAGLSNFTKVNTYEAGQFADVKAGAWYEKSIATAYELGLVAGMSADSFAPDGNLTIAQTLVLAARLHSIYNTGKANFEQGSPWYQVYVDYCVKNGIIASGEYSNMSAQATRAQFARIFAAAMPADALPAINALEGYEVPDIPMDADYYDAAYLLYRAGILTGSDKYGTFNPRSSIKRSEVATIVTRMADKSQRKTIGEFEQKEVIPENMQGVYRSLDGLYEVVWNGKEYSVVCYEKYEEGSSWLDCYYGYANSGLRQNIYSYANENDKFEDVTSCVENDKTLFGLAGSCMIIDYYDDEFDDGIELYLVSEAVITPKAEKLIGSYIIPAENRNPESITGIELNNTNGTIYATGEYYYIGILLTIDGKQHHCYDRDMLICTTSNSNVFSIDEYGALIALNAGTAVYGASINGQSDSVVITVVKNPGEDIEYISDRWVFYDGEDDVYRFLFSFKDKNYNRIKADANVDIRIVNDGVTVYEGTHYVDIDWSYDYWTHSDWAEDKLLACVDIPAEAVAKGRNTSGTFYYTISEYYGNAYFDEFTLTIYDLPSDNVGSAILNIIDYCTLVLEYTADSIDYMTSAMTTTNASTGALYAQKAQGSFANVSYYLGNAINECGDSEQLQEVKACLLRAKDASDEVCEYAITTSNYLDFFDVLLDGNLVVAEELNNAITLLTNI